MKINRLLAAVVAAGIAFGALADQPFRDHRYDSFKATPTQEGQIVFAGNSITNMHSWFEAFGSHQEVIGRGNSGGFAYELLDNLESYIDSKPAKFFVMIGTNDVSSGQSAAITAKRIQTIVRRVRLESPETEVYVETILPRAANAKPDYEACNDIMREWIPSLNDPKVHLVDLSETMQGMATDNAWTYDWLHPRPKGYAAWCHFIEDRVGYPTVYPQAADLTKQDPCDAGNNSNGGRVEQFPYFPVSEGDVLFFGDEQVHGGEWHELLRSNKIKDRAQCWGWGGINLVAAKKVIASALKDQAVKPAKIFLFYGVGGKDETNYRAMVDEAKTQAPDAKIYLVSLTPSTNGSTDNANVAFNTVMQTVATEKGATYVDVYTPLKAEIGKNIMNTNYVSGHGYIVMANELAKYLTEEGVNPVTEEEYDAVYARRTARTIIGNALTDVYMAIDQLPADVKATVEQCIEEAGSIINNDDLTAEQAQAAADRINMVLSNYYAPIASTDTENHWYVMTSMRGNKVATISGDVIIGDSEVPTTTSTGENVWKFVTRTDGTYDIVSANGCYISPTAAHNTQLTVSEDVPAAGWQLKMAQAGPGYFVIYSGTTAELNQTAAGAVFNWYGATCPNLSDQGCTYSFTEFTGTIEEPAPIEVPDPVLTLVDHTLDGTAPYRVEDVLAQPVLTSTTNTIVIDVTTTSFPSDHASIVSACDSDGSNFYSVGRCNNNSKIQVRYIGAQGAEGWYTRDITAADRVKVAIVNDQTEGLTIYSINGAVVQQVWKAQPSAFGAYEHKHFGNVNGAESLYLGGVVNSDSDNKYPMVGTVHSARFYDVALDREQIKSLEYDNLVESSAINEIVVPGNNQQGIYDLQGRRVVNPAKGIYIKNGRKFLCR